jgi:nucleoid-associated protein YgaU
VHFTATAGSEQDQHDPHDLVEPPTLSLPPRRSGGSAFADVSAAPLAALESPPLVDRSPPAPADDVPAPLRTRATPRPFPADPSATRSAAPPLRRDPAVAPAVLENPAVAAARSPSRFNADSSPPAGVPLPLDRQVPAVRSNPPPSPLRAAGLVSPAIPSSAAGFHVAREGDSWWSVAQQSYGDGRLYRALFAWNRTLDRRVSLAPGTRLEIPPASQLKAAWAKLVPAE